MQCWGRGSFASQEGMSPAQGGSPPPSPVILKESPRRASKLGRLSRKGEWLLRASPGGGSKRHVSCALPNKQRGWKDSPPHPPIQMGSQAEKGHSFPYLRKIAMTKKEEETKREPETAPTGQWHWWGHVTHPPPPMGLGRGVSTSAATLYKAHPGATLAAQKEPVLLGRLKEQAARKGPLPSRPRTRAPNRTGQLFKSRTRPLGVHGFQLPFPQSTT